MIEKCSVTKLCSLYFSLSHTPYIELEAFKTFLDLLNLASPSTKNSRLILPYSIIQRIFYNIL